MRKGKVIGVCKLCLETKQLRKSHFIPAAMYKYLRDPGSKNPHPVVLGRRVTAKTSEQMQDYIPCASCEDLFNKNGESWMIAQVWNGKAFPLLGRLSVAHPHYTFRRYGALAFSGTSVGIDTDKLGYFALSILWRAAVHVWRLPLGGETRQVVLGSTEEHVRRFLLGESPFPADVVVMVHVCSDSLSAGTFHAPAVVRGQPIPSYGFRTLGVDFTIFPGENIPPTIREFCCVKSPRRLIFLKDCGEKTFGELSQIMATSRPAKNLS